MPDDFADRAARFTGEYRPNRFSHTTIAKIGAAGALTVSATDRGTLRALGTEWVEVAPLIFEEQSGGPALVFRADEEGKITHFFHTRSPAGAYERVPLSDHQNIHIPLLILAIVTIVVTLLSPVIGWGSRRWYGVHAEDLSRLPVHARRSLWLAAAMFGVGVSSIFVILQTGSLSREVPWSLGLALLIPILAVVPTLGSAVFAVRMWGRGEGRPAVRVLYSVAVVSFTLILWQLSVWNLLGWKY